MKIKLYFIQEVINDSVPYDCVGELFIFKSEEERGDKLKTLEFNEQYDYFKFEKEIEL